MPSTEESSAGPLHATTARATVTRNIREEAGLAYTSSDHHLGLNSCMMNDLVTEAVRRNSPGIIVALYEYNITSNKSSLLFEAAEHADRAALDCLLRLRTWKPSDARNALLLHSTLRLMKVCTMEEETLRTGIPRSRLGQAERELNLIAAADESFERSLQVDAHFSTRPKQAMA